jgi:hypothetical protein
MNLQDTPIEILNKCFWETGMQINVQRDKGKVVFGVSNERF